MNAETLNQVTTAAADQLSAKQADLAETSRCAQAEREARLKAEQNAPPVDYSARILSSGLPETPDHREIDPATGQQKDYIILTPAERAKGFIRPVRRSYVHVGKPPDGMGFEYPITRTFPGGCGTRTTMSLSIAETYARCPDFYSGTFCCTCGKHLPLNEFVWEGTNEQVGS